MNMVRIRRIMEMRKILKAPPLLPPKLKRSSFDSVERRNGSPKEIIDFNFQLRNIKMAASETLVVTVYESEGGGVEGPWRLAATSECFSPMQLVDLPAVFSIEFMFETSQPLRIELCGWSEEAIVSFGFTMFNVAEVVTSKRLTRPMISEANRDCIAVIDIFSTLKPRPQPIFVQLEGRDFHRKLVPDNAMIFVQVSDAFPVDKNDPSSAILYRSEGARMCSGRVCWRPFTIQMSPDQDDDDPENRFIEMVVCYRDDKTRVEGVIGRMTSTLAQLQRDPSMGNVYLLSNVVYKEGKKAVGILEVVKASPIEINSFLDYISAGTSLHISFAIDFSSDEETSLPPTFESDVEFSIRSIGDVGADYASRSISAFGFGARVPPQNRESQQFCLNLETNPACDGISGVVDTFHTAARTVLPSKTAHLSHVIYYVAKMAQNAFVRRENGMQYYVLVIITRGVIDDLKEAVQAVIFASRSPLSIVFVGIADGRMDELERLGSAGTRLAFQGRKVARDCVHFVNAKAHPRSDPPTEEDRSNLTEKALYRLPQQLAVFMTKQNLAFTPKSSLQSTVPSGRPRGYTASMDIGASNDDLSFDEQGGNYDYGTTEPRQRLSPHASKSSLQEWSDDSGCVDSPTAYQRGPSPQSYQERGKRSFPRLANDMRSLSIQNDNDRTQQRRLRHEFPT